MTKYQNIAYLKLFYIYGFETMFFL